MPQVDDKRKAARHRAAGVMRLLRLIRILPLGAALAAWLIALAAVSLLPGCDLAGGSVQGCRLSGRDISQTVHSLGLIAPFLLAAGVPWFAVMSLVIALVAPRRT